MRRGTDLRANRKITRDTNRSENRRLVLQSVFALEPVSRADVARTTGLGKPYVSELVSELVSDGPVFELGIGTSEVGRPPTMLGIDVGHQSTVAIDVSGDPFRGYLTDLRGSRLPGTEKTVMRQSGSSIDGVRELCAQLLDTTQRDILGIGIGAPGVVDDQGKVLMAATGIVLLGFVGSFDKNTVMSVELVAFYFEMLGNRIQERRSALRHCDINGVIEPVS